MGLQKRSDDQIQNAEKGDKGGMQDLIGGKAVSETVTSATASAT